MSDKTALGERSAFRAAATLRRRDGILTDLASGEKISDVDTWAARFALEFRPGERQSWRLTVEGSEVCYAKDGGPDKRCYRVDCSKIDEVLPTYQPQWTVRLGVEELNTAYRRVNLQQEDLEGSRYLRINHITKLIDTGKLDADLRWIQS